MMKKTLTIIFSILTITIVGCSGIDKEYKETIYSLENDLEEVNKRIEQNKNLLDEIGKVIAQLEKVIEQREAQIGDLHIKVLTLELMTEKNFSIIKGGEIPLHNWINEINLDEILGKPITEELRELKGDGFSGSFIKELTYDGIELTLFSPNGDSFWVMEMNIHSQQFKTFRGIKVGDDIEALMEAYPNVSLALDGTSQENNGVYQIFLSENSLNFKVENGQITSISHQHEIN